MLDLLEALRSFAAGGIQFTLLPLSLFLVLLHEAIGQRLHAHPANSMTLSPLTDSYSQTDGTKIIANTGGSQVGTTQATRTSELGASTKTIANGNAGVPAPPDPTITG